MIQIMYSAPCTYDRRLMGFAEAEIGYTGENPVETALKYIGQILGARLWAVVKDGHIWYGK
jgi:hypothetical protein